jgi:2-C-methyl-D-erythritol 4-phosphate cytidylyltransferase/2-C-methyl-D-erythritol 2,4-cyclodiphosphate synthase
MHSNNYDVILVAAGTGERFGADRNVLPKQYQLLSGIPVICHSLSLFFDDCRVQNIILVYRDGHDKYLENAISYFSRNASNGKSLHTIHGGETRQDSVLKGLEYLSHIEQQSDNVLIHDAARPLVTKQSIDALLIALEDYEGAIVCREITDTLKFFDDTTLKDGPDRAFLRAAETPQAFHFGSIFKAHKHASSGHTDDASIAAAEGIDVRPVISLTPNFKITTKEDLAMAEAYLGHIKPEIIFETRTGIGYDVHAFCEGNHVTLCGVDLPFERGLLGHSDADVPMHALTDALLGALSDGDIGDHFPPSELQWENKESSHFLEFAMHRLRDQKGRLINADITIIAEAPKIGPYRERMRQTLASICRVSQNRIAVKATTNEQIGFVGRQEGIASIATVSIELPRI